jgi:hypothetical protein
MAVEEIHLCMEIPGGHGVHIMAVAWEEIIPEVLKRPAWTKNGPSTRVKPRVAWPRAA